MSFTESIVQSRLNREAGELEMSERMSGETFESLPLRAGDTTLEREVLPDGAKGQIRICTQEAEDILRTSVVYNRYLLKDGQIVTDPGHRGAERRVRGFKKAKILARIAFGRVDHWDSESDFYGTVEEFDE
jgi:hypothetical protein